MTGWNNDMDAAPRQGEEFQAWVAYKEGDGFWAPRARYNPDTEAFEMWGRVDYDEDGWDVYSACAPTHWAPQPTPPTG